MGKNIKRYHSDNAKKQRTKALLKELESKGTKVSSTAPNSSQKISIAERRFGAILAETITALAASGLPGKVWSVVCLDAIDKSNFTPIKRENRQKTGPNSGISGGPQSGQHLFSFGNAGIS